MDKCPVCGYDEWEEPEDTIPGSIPSRICGHCGYEVSEAETEWVCENCGKPIKVGDLIIEQASGTMTSTGPQLGDRFIMHQNCPDDE